MAAIPAFCPNPNCRLIFPSILGNVESAPTLTLRNNQQPCPKCGTMAPLLEGVINVVGNTIEILQATGATAEQLSRLAELLREAARTRQTPEQVADTVNRELPSLGTLAKHLLVPRTPEAFYAVLIFAATAALLVKEPSTTSVDQRVTVNQVIENIYLQPPAVGSIAPGTGKAGTSGTGKPGRNEPCPCGSGKKYKHCHGALGVPGASKECDPASGSQPK
jgi:hypothetical protein